MFSNHFFSVFDYVQKPSIYVVSDSQLAEWKQKQAQAEIDELDRLIEGHKQSIERLESTKKAISQSELPQSQPPEKLSSE